MTGADTPISNREFLRALLVAVVALGISAALVIGGYLLAFPLLHSEFLPQRDSASSFSLKGKDFTPVVAADGGYEGDSIVITALAEGRPDDQAILMRKVRLRASDYAFLRYDLEGRHPGLRVMLFWKTVAGGDTPHYSELDNPGNGLQYHNLRRSEEWDGEITELAIGFFGDLRGGQTELRGVRLEPYGARSLLGTIWGEWTHFKPWDQKSINRYVGVSEGALLYPTPIAAFWLAVAACIALGWYWARKRMRATPTYRLAPGLAIITSIAWLALHGLWLHKLWLQNQETRYLFHGKSVHERRLADWDGEYYEFAQKVKDALPDDVDRLALLFIERDMFEPFPQRLRYHFMPDVKLDFIRQITPGRVRYIASEYSYLLIMHNPDTPHLDIQSLLDEYRYELTGNDAVLIQNGVGTLLRFQAAPAKHTGERA